MPVGTIARFNEPTYTCCCHAALPSTSKRETSRWYTTGSGHSASLTTTSAPSSISARATGRVSAQPLEPLRSSQKRELHKTSPWALSRTTRPFHEELALG